MHFRHFVLLALLLVFTQSKMTLKHQNDISHIKVLQSEQFQNQQSHSRRNLQALTRNSIRITLDTTSLSTVTTSTSSAVLSFISQVIQVAKQFLTSRIQVSPQSGNNIAPSTCVDFTTTNNDQTSGIALSDLHVYISYITDGTQQYTATGKYCKTSLGSTSSPSPDPTLARGRPTMGRIKFNTAYTLDNTTLTNRLFADTTASTLSEMIHIMGFDSALYTSYLDSTINNVYVSQVMQTATGLAAGRLATKMITTPKVVAWARSWFNCASINGMLLEDQAPDGNSYWERTLMYDEIMTRTTLSAQRGISGLTFALLKDMGWYNVDDTFNDTSPYGYQKGCEFFFNGCNSTTTFTQFCNSSLSVKSCTSQSFSKGVCQINPYSDNCGIWINTINCVDPNAQDDGYKTQSQQVYGTSSFCITSTLATVALDSNLQSRCYPYTCFDDNSIKFTIGTSSILCSPTDFGTVKTLSGLVGTLTCPDYKSFCWISRKVCPNWCSQNGFCTRGICNCRSGYSGADCSITTCVTSIANYNPTTTTCVSQCPSSTYSNAYSFTCLPCVNCTQCVKQSTVCTSCVGGVQFMYNGVCYNSCPAQTYVNGSVCINCVAPCYNCTSNTTSSCTSCTGGLYLSTPTLGTCATTCNNPIYQLYDQVNFLCVSSCTDNLVQVGVNTCQMCASGLFKNSSNLCNDTCPAGYYPDSTRRFCGLCDVSCQSCIDVYAQNCTACWPNATNSYLYIGQCVFNTSCPDGTYADSVALACQSCPVAMNCSTCQNTTALGVVCIECNYGWFMSTAGTCDAGCASNQYANNGNNSCVNCNPGCASCTSPTNTSCTTCAKNSFLLTNASGGYCLSTCPPIGYYNDSTQCLVCYSSCNTCTDGLISSCLSCQSNMFLYNGHCYDACPPSTFMNNATSTCDSCDSTCRFCYGPQSTNCSQCISSYILSNTSCVTSCPKGQSPNQWSVCVGALRIVLTMTLIMGCAWLM